jgi:hypothetical protein
MLASTAVSLEGREEQVMRAFYSQSAPELGKVTEIATAAAEAQAGAEKKDVGGVADAIDTGLDVADLTTDLGGDGLVEALATAGEAVAALGEGAASVLGAIGDLLGGL